MPKIKLPTRVYAKHGSYWFVDLPDRKWHKLCRIAEGEAKMYEALAGRLKAPPLNRMPAAIVAFKADYLAGLAASTQKEHARLLDIAGEEFAEFDVADVQPVDVSRSVKHLYPDTLTAARHYKARLSTFFRWAIERGLRNTNPCREIWLKTPPRRDRYITDDELDNIRAKLLVGDDGKATRAGEMVRAFVELCYLTVQRPTDIRRLVWSRVRDEAIAFKPSKTEGSSGARVLVPITPAIRAVLDRARAFVPKTRKGRPQTEIKSIYVVHKLDGGPYTMSGLRSAWQRACARVEVDGVRVGIKNATIKDLRPKALSDAKRAGYDNAQLQVAAAHASVTTTEGYMRGFDEPVSAVRLTLKELP